MTIKNIIEATKGELHLPGGCDYAPDNKITGVIIDSRLIEPGHLFIATRGERVDGHSFIGKAKEKGAVAVVCEEMSAAPIPHIVIKDSLKALKDIAVFYRNQLDIPMIGITGSVGKTSTKEFIAAVLSTRFKTHLTEGNHNNEIGVPLTILKIRAEHQIAVLEMGINDFGEMHRLSEMVRPDIAVLTNIGDCHLERLKDRSGVLKAKSEIFDFLASDGNAIVNGDDILLRTIPDINGKAKLCYGIGAENDIIAEAVTNLGLDGTSAQIRIKKTNEIFEIRIPLPGEHMIYNALSAIAVGNLFGISPAEMSQGFKSLKSVPGRSNIIRLPAGIIIDDCYNANPYSMKSALRLLASSPGRKVAILGDMGELGTDKLKLHEKVGQEAVSAGADILVCIGEFSKKMFAGAKAAAGGNAKHIYYFADKESFLNSAGQILSADDTILIKASRFMAFETLVESLKVMPLFG
ncbi:MAG: UDP-N-acetylmuramoyl-tripeptide--D-alanyl-D-alanine ligase [Lachnospiraceae bacterium]|nr:UDP-N-acetylmuramoyl-tripeptide--D-alanyl-D-alanine ligase [Lachnospiraceae bacterium]